MKKFETPEIKVVMFKTNDVITTSGYEGNVGEGDLDSYFSAGSSASQPASEFTF